MITMLEIELSLWHQSESYFLICCLVTCDAHQLTFHQNPCEHSFSLNNQDPNYVCIMENTWVECDNSF